MSKKQFRYLIKDSEKTYYRASSLKEVRQRAELVPAHCTVHKMKLRAGGLLEEPTTTHWRITEFYGKNKK